MSYSIIYGLYLFYREDAGSVTHGHTSNAQEHYQKFVRWRTKIGPPFELFVDTDDPTQVGFLLSISKLMKHL